MAILAVIILHLIRSVGIRSELFTKDIHNKEKSAVVEIFATKVKDNYAIKNIFGNVGFILDSASFSHSNVASSNSDSNYELPLSI